MKHLLIICILVITATCVSTYTLAKPCTFSWLEKTEGDATIGYKIYYGEESGEYTVVTDVGYPDIVDGRHYATLPMCVPGTFYFACTAYSIEEESEFSIELSWDNPIPIITSITRSE